MTKSTKPKQPTKDNPASSHEQLLAANLAKQLSKPTPSAKPPRSAAPQPEVQEDAKEKDEQAANPEPQPKKLTMVAEMVSHPLVWMQEYTRTKDSHWREAGASSPYRPLPAKHYFRPLSDGFQQEPVLFIEKSRDMMLSWLSVGLFTHAAMTTPGREVLFQSQKLEKACELVGYAKILYEQSDEAIRKAYPLSKGVQASGELAFANGSRIIAIPGGADQIRSYHPWGLLMDEAAFMPEAADSYNNAVPVCQKIVALSSAGPGWFADVCSSAIAGKELVRGMTEKWAPQGIVFRIHYSADRERDPSVNPKWMEGERKKYSSQSTWDREQEIIHEAGGGERLFAEVLSRWTEQILIDPKESGFQPSPHWKRIAGFDHGKANPTAALVAAMDQDGVLYILREYYQPGLSPKEHRPHLAMLNGFLGAEAYADPSIFYKTQAQSDGSFKAIADLYIEEGIANLIPALSNAESTGMERILKHWIDLDDRMPTLKIVCPRSMREIGRPVYGVHNDGCPNLLWELKRARREELSAGQLVNRNPTEKIVDKDNHLRDCLKYIVSAFLEPANQTPEMRAQAAISNIPKEDVTSRMIRFQDALLREKELGSAPRVPMGIRGVVKLALINARKNRH
ncbi:MAG TPA: hypothetical protein VI685_21640 [Candidatus Angelobacter sp.]